LEEEMQSLKKKLPGVHQQSMVDKLEAELQTITKMMNDALREKTIADDERQLLQHQVEDANKLITKRSTALTLDPSLPCNANMLWSEILTTITTLRRTCTFQLEDEEQSTNSNTSHGEGEQSEEAHIQLKDNASLEHSSTEEEDSADSNPFKTYGKAPPTTKTDINKKEAPKANQKAQQTNPFEF